LTRKSTTKGTRNLHGGKRLHEPSITSDEEYSSTEVKSNAINKPIMSDTRNKSIEGSGLQSCQVALKPPLSLDVGISIRLVKKCCQLLRVNTMTNNKDQSGGILGGG
jgi:hypothetical protein